MPVLPELQKWVRLFFQRAGPKRTRMVDIGREKERRGEEGKKEKIDCSVHIVKWVASKRNCPFPFFLKIR